MKAGCEETDPQGHGQHCCVPEALCGPHTEDETLDLTGPRVLNVCANRSKYIQSLGQFGLSIITQNSSGGDIRPGVG